MKFPFICLCLISVSTFASSIFERSFELVEHSNNWEDRISCTESVNYMPPECGDENVTCELRTAGLNKIYEVCKTYQTVIKYSTDKEGLLYVEAHCVSPIGSGNGWSFKNTVVQIKAFDNSNNEYYGSKPMIFTKEVASEKDCKNTVDTIRNPKGISLKLNFQTKIFDIN